MSPLGRSWVSSFINSGNKIVMSPVTPAKAAWVVPVYEKNLVGPHQIGAMFRPLYFRRDQKLTQLVETSATPTHYAGAIPTGAVLRHFANPTPLFEHSLPDVAPGVSDDWAKSGGRAQLVRRSHRSLRHAAQGWTRKRGALYNRGSGEGGSTRTILTRACMRIAWLAKL
jgi:hypothetical protein